MDPNITTTLIGVFGTCLAEVIGALVGAWATARIENRRSSLQPTTSHPVPSAPIASSDVKSETKTRKLHGAGAGALVGIVIFVIIVIFVGRSLFPPVSRLRNTSASMLTPDGNEHQMQTQVASPIRVIDCYDWRPKVTVTAVPDSPLKCCSDTRVRWILQQNGSKQEGLISGANNKSNASFLAYSDNIPLEAILTQDNNQIIELELFIEAYTHSQRWVYLSDKPQRATIYCTYQGGQTP